MFYVFYFEVWYQRWDYFVLGRKLEFLSGLYVFYLFILWDADRIRLIVKADCVV